MTSYLEGCQRNSCKNNVSCGVADTVTQSGDIRFEGWEDAGYQREEEAEEGHEEELDQRESCRLRVRIENRFRGSIRESARQIPNHAEYLWHQNQHCCPEKQRGYAL